MDESIMTLKIDGEMLKAFKEAIKEANDEIKNEGICSLANREYMNEKQMDILKKVSISRIRHFVQGGALKSLYIDDFALDLSEEASMPAVLHFRLRIDNIHVDIAEEKEDE